MSQQKNMSVGTTKFFAWTKGRYTHTQETYFVQIHICPNDVSTATAAAAAVLMQLPFVQPTIFLG